MTSQQVRGGGDSEQDDDDSGCAGFSNSSSDDGADSKHSSEASDIGLLHDQFHASYFTLSCRAKRSVRYIGVTRTCTAGCIRPGVSLRFGLLKRD